MEKGKHGLACWVKYGYLFELIGLTSAHVAALKNINNSKNYESTCVLWTQGCPDK
jgi:hypothetical protein